MHRLVLLRHGQSTWNKTNQFTGWTDVGLTEQGVAEAHESARLLREGFDVATLEARIDELADLIRPDVYADTNKMYSNGEFELNLYYPIQTRGPDGTIYGLRQFVQQLSVGSGIDLALE